MQWRSIYNHGIKVYIVSEATTTKIGFSLGHILKFLFVSCLYINKSICSSQSKINSNKKNLYLFDYSHVKILKKSTNGTINYIKKKQNVTLYIFGMVPTRVLFLFQF